MENNILEQRIKESIDSINNNIDKATDGALIRNNGCSGGCCRNFTLSYHIEDLQKMKELNERNKETAEFNNKLKKGEDWKKSENVFIDKVGRTRNTFEHDDIEKLLYMLIFLGDSNIDPQTMKIVMNPEHFDQYYDKSWNKDKIDWYFKKEDGKIYMRTYTCKYYDTIAGICTNYENRPNLCKSFGTTCSYKGCWYAKKIQTENLFLEAERKLECYNPERSISDNTVQFLESKDLEKADVEDYEYTIQNKVN